MDETTDINRELMLDANATAGSALRNFRHGNDSLANRVCQVVATKARWANCWLSPRDRASCCAVQDVKMLSCGSSKRRMPFIWMPGEPSI